MYAYVAVCLSLWMSLSQAPCCPHQEKNSQLPNPAEWVAILTELSTGQVPSWKAETLIPARTSVRLENEETITTDQSEGAQGPPQSSGGLGLGNGNSEIQPCSGRAWTGPYRLHQPAQLFSVSGLTWGDIVYAST